MDIKKFIVKRVERRHLKHFVEENHYSGNINGIISDYCFALFDGERMIGAAIFGRMAMAGQYKRFSEKESDVIELRRLCCIDEAPKNTESYFIGNMIRWMKKNTDLKIIVSYADEEYGHSGTIYKASNFEYWGKKPGARVIIWNGKKYHDKAIRTKNKGVLKPFAIAIKQALDNGDAHYKKTSGKHTYVYRLNKK